MLSKIDPTDFSLFTVSKILMKIYKTTTIGDNNYRWHLSGRWVGHVLIDISKMSSTKFIQFFVQKILYSNVFKNFFSLTIS